MKGHIEKRKGARGITWRVRIELPRDEQGRRRSKSYSCPTRKEAERELPRLLRELDTGQWADPASLTVGEYLKRWLSDAAKPAVGRRTFERYGAIVRLHVVPTLGDVPLAKLRPLHLQRLYTHLADEGMSAAGVGKVHARLHTALRQAVRWQMLRYNPADGVELPRVRRRPPQALSEADTARLLRAAQAPDGHKVTRMWAPLVLAVLTGMRRGELLGLRWCDVDLENGALSVVQALEQDGHDVYVKVPKTERSRRRISLPPFAMATLRSHRATQDEERLRAGVKWRDGDYVFAAVGGGPWCPANFSRAYRLVLKRTAGKDDDGNPIPPLECRFHDLRHTHASQLLRQGTHAKVVSERLGHANIGITLDLYSHVLPGLQEEAAERWNASMTAALAACQTAHS
jgi:integrase